MNTYSETFSRLEAEALVRDYYHLLPTAVIGTRALLGENSYPLLDRALELVVSRHQQNLNQYIANSLTYNQKEDQLTVTISFAN